MNFQLSRLEIWSRGALYVVLAVNSFLLADPYFREHVSPALLVAIGACNAGLLVVRTFIDQSPSQGNQTPVTVETAPGQPIETTPADPDKEVEPKEPTD